MKLQCEKNEKTERILRHAASHMNKKINFAEKEKGAVAIEATLSLTFFMFLIVTLLSIVNLCIAQAKIGIALNQTAKEISQYTYIYSLTGFNEIQKDMNASVADQRQDIENVEQSVVDSLNGLKKLGNNEASFDETFNTIGNTYEEIEQVAEKIAGAEDKTAWVTSIIKICGNEGYEALKGVLGGALAKGLIQKHLVSKEGDDCDRYLRHLGVVDGLHGLNLMNSAIFVNGTDDIMLICKYKISVVKLFNKEYSFSFVQTAYTKAWGAQALAGKNSDSEDAVTGKFVLVNEGEGSKFGEYAAKAKPIDGYVDVIIHASSDGELKVMHNGEWKTITTGNLQQWLKQRGYEKTPIRLISCGTGSDTSKVAQSVADKLKVEVLAPTDTVWAYPDGKLVVGPDAKTNTGEWKSFTPYKPDK